MSARDDILGRIRERLGGTEDRRSGVEMRLRERPAGPLPARARGDAAELRGRFVEQARAASAEILEAGADSSIAAAVAGLLPRDGGSHGIVVDDSLEPRDGAWADHGLVAECRRARTDDALGVSRAFCGVAETGTAVLRSGAGRPTSAAFLPPIHVVVLAAHDIVGSYEEAWARIRETGEMPRTVNWITGPSRSADIEQTLNMGAHGPVRLVFLLVDAGD